MDKNKEHGGNLIHLSELSNRSIDTILDFSVNVRADGMPDFLKASFLRAINHCDRYPSPHGEEAKRAAAKYFGIEKQHFVFGNGSNEILHASLRLLAENGYNRLCIFEPAFSEYSIAGKKAGMEIISLQIPLQDTFSYAEKTPPTLWDSFDNSICIEDSASLKNPTSIENPASLKNSIYNNSASIEDSNIPIKEYNFSELDDIIQNIPAHSVIILANPSNPSGLFIPLKIYGKWVQKRKDCVWIFDEAFIDYIANHTKESAINLLSENCMILRSLTKFYAIASLRIGYLVSNIIFAEKLQESLPAWNVNGIALACVETIFTQDKRKEIVFQDAEETRRLNSQRKLNLYSLLQKIEGIHIYPSQGNFVLFSLPNAPKDLWKKLLIEHGIALRDCSNYNGLETGHYFRIAVRFPHEHEKLVNALQDICEQESILKNGKERKEKCQENKSQALRLQNEALENETLENEILESEILESEILECEILESEILSTKFHKNSLSN